MNTQKVLTAMAKATGENGPRYELDKIKVSSTGYTVTDGKEAWHLDECIDCGDNTALINPQALKRMVGQNLEVYEVNDADGVTFYADNDKVTVKNYEGEFPNVTEFMTPPENCDYMRISKKALQQIVALLTTSGETSGKLCWERPKERRVTEPIHININGKIKGVSMPWGDKDND